MLLPIIITSSLSRVVNKINCCDDAICPGQHFGIYQLEKANSDKGHCLDIYV